VAHLCKPPLARIGSVGMATAILNTTFMILYLGVKVKILDNSFPDQIGRMKELSELALT
jgi:hypothetical protein